MSDEDLAIFLGLCPEERHLIDRMTPEKRESLKAMAAKAIEVELYDAGLGPKPEGVIVCGPKQIRGARIRKESRSKTIRRQIPSTAVGE